MMRTLYPPIEPYRTHRFEVSGGHNLYVEEVGDPYGVPAVFLHGGPGGGIVPAARRFFDPARYRVVLVDQRGSGRSTPRGSLHENTTAHLAADLEVVRDALDIPATEKLWAIAGFIIESYRHDPDLMKVIIIEVTRAANSFGGAHIGKISEAYELIAGVVRKAQARGEFRTEIPAEFAVMAFYGAIEQVLTGWIFGLLDEGDEGYEQAKTHVVETICGGLAA